MEQRLEAVTVLMCCTATLSAFERRLMNQMFIIIILLTG